MPGPDFTYCGHVIEWGDRTEMDEHFGPAIEQALRHRGLDVELARWALDDALAPEYERWWVKQRTAVRRHVNSIGRSTRVTISRRTDQGDGIVKCYVRANGVRAVAAVA